MLFKRVAIAVGVGIGVTAVGLGAGNVLGSTPVVKASSDTVAVDETNFPDEAFREYVLANVDSDKNKVLDDSEMNAVTKIETEELGIKSIAGMEYFPNLEEVVFFCEEVTSADLSMNPKLRSANFTGNHITELNLKHCDNLEELYLLGNRLLTLDLTTCPNLKSLVCSENQLSKLDLTKCTELVDFSCTNNQIKDLDLSNCAKLQEFDISSNEVWKLDVSHNPELTGILANGNEIEELDLSQNPKLEVLYISENAIEALDVSNHKALYFLDCGGCPLTSLNVDGCDAMKILSLSQAKINEIDLTRFPKLEVCYLDNTKISTLDTSKNPDLHILAVNGTKLSTLNIYYNTGLVSAYYCGSQTEQNGVITYEYYDADDTCNCLCVDKTLDLQLTKEPAPTATPTATPVPGKPTATPTMTPSATPTPTITPTPVDTPVPTPEEYDFESFVIRLYEKALNREPEQEGKDFWVKKVKDEGATGGECAHFFLVDAPEFMDRNLTDDELVEVLYATFFDRASEKEGKDFWMKSLADGMSRKLVVECFIDSIEWCELCAKYGVKSGAPTAKSRVPSTASLNFVNRLYKTCMGRDADDEGLMFWSLALTNLETTGAQTAKFFYESDELKDLAKEDLEFVRRLYTGLMGRDADTNDEEYWLEQLSSGKKTRADLIAFFATCEEFTKICADYGIERGEI